MHKLTNKELYETALVRAHDKFTELTKTHDYECDCINDWAAFAKATMRMAHAMGYKSVLLAIEQSAKEDAKIDPRFTALCILFCDAANQVLDEQYTGQLLDNLVDEVKNLFGI